MGLTYTTSRDPDDRHSWIRKRYEEENQMKIIAMLSFYDEDPQWIEELMVGVSQFADVLVAIDGAYDLYKGERKFSERQITAPMFASGIEHVHLDIGHEWSGNETEKRQYMLDKALDISEPGDWLMIVDSDYLFKEIPRIDIFRKTLQTTSAEAIDINFYESEDGTGVHKMRMFMRALPGMFMDGNHFTYRLPDGRHHHVLVRDSTAPSIQAEDILVQHRCYLRDEKRREDQTAYYEQRDEQGIET